MTALYDQMTQWEFRRSARLEAGLGQKNLTAAETVQELFVSTFGDELSWTEPVREWRDEVLAQHGLNRETVSTAAGSGRSALAGGGTHHRQNDGRGVRRPTAGRTSKPLCK